jgi:ABC-type nitrate/sulfonate/bicarbonate transport system substrate-binding protein
LLNSNGDAITVSRDLYEAGAKDAVTLAVTIKGARRERPLTFGVPHQFSTHHFLLLHWLRPVGIAPGREIHIVVLPPSLMPVCLASGDIDGYCVGEPFNSLAVREGTGVIVAESADILPMHPEKAFLVSQEFHDLDPDRHLQLIRGIAEAAEQCETPAGRELVIGILSRPDYLGMDSALIRSSLFAGEAGVEGSLSSKSFHLFSHPEVNRPDAGKADWLVAQMRHAGLLDKIDLRSGPPLNHIFREDFYEEAMAPALSA